MADIETDLYQTTVSVVKVFEAETWPTAFDAAPGVLLMSTTDKKKSGCKNVTSTGADISCETTDVRVFLTEAGFEAEKADVHPERDAGQEQISSSKVYQSFTFNSTFSSTPIAVGGHEGATAGGKKNSFDNLTTTGGDIAGEVVNEWVNWAAFEIGDYQ